MVLILDHKPAAAERSEAVQQFKILAEHYAYLAG